MMVMAGASLVLGTSVASANDNNGQQKKGQRTFQATSSDLLNFPTTNTPASGAATITIHRDPHGHVSDVTISDPVSGSLVHTGSANAASGLVADPLTRFTFAPQGWTIVSLLNHSAFGTWITTPTAGGPSVAGAVAGGKATPPGQIPKNGTASYSGKTFGVGVETGQLVVMPVFISGDAAIKADFGHGQVTTNLNNLTSTQTAVGTGFNPIGSPSPLGNMSGTASLNGNKYSGNVSGNLSVLGATVPAQGTLQGGFFGSGAQETAGTWQFAGSRAAPPFAAITAIGSFGAVKQH
jgi:hypothetical protein